VSALQRRGPGPHQLHHLDLTSEAALESRFLVELLFVLESWRLGQKEVPSVVLLERAMSVQELEQQFRQQDCSRLALERLEWESVAQELELRFLQGCLLESLV
jgi:hypothetical protein